MATLMPSSFIGPSLFLQVTRKTIISWMGLKLDKIGPRTMASTAFEHLKKSMYNVVTTLGFHF